MPEGLQIVIGADISAVTSNMQAASASVAQFGDAAAAAFDEVAASASNMNITPVTNTLQAASASIDNFTETAAQSFDELAASAAALDRIQAGIDQAASAAVGAGARFDTLGGRLPLRDFNTFRSSVDRLRSDISSGLVPQISRITPAITPIAPAANNAGSALGGIRPGANQAASALTNVGRVAQDLPFGFIGIQNNLNPLLESFQRLRAETGSGRAALAALGQSLLGPAGIGIALSVVSSAFLIFQNGIAGFNKKSKEAKDAAEDLAKSLKSISLIQDEAKAGIEGQLTQVNALAAAVADSNKPYEQRKRALEELKEVNKSYFGDLKLEDAATGALTKTVEEYTKALVNSAIQKQFVDEIASVAKQAADADDEIRKARNKLTRAQEESNRVYGASADAIRAAEAGSLSQSKQIRAETAAQGELSLANEKSTKLLEQEAILRDKLNKAVGEGLKLKDLDTEKTKKEQDFLTKQLSLLEKIRDAQKERLGNLFDLKDIDAATNKLAALEQQIGDLKLQIAVRDAQKAGLPPVEIEKLKQAVKQNTQKALSDLFEKEALLLEGSPKLKFSQTVKTEIPSNLTFIHTNIGFSDAIINDAVSKAFGLDKKIPVITLHEVRLKLLGAKLTAFVEGKEAIEERLSNEIGSAFNNLKLESLTTLGETIGNIFSGDISDALQKGAKAMLSIIGDTMQQIGKYVINAAIQIKLLKETLKKFIISNPVLAIAAGVGLIAAGAALKNVTFAGPKFADGGIVTGPVIGQIGEMYKPEVIMPLDRLKVMLGQNNNSSTGTQLIPIINNEGLYLAMKRGERSAGRKF